MKTKYSLFGLLMAWLLIATYIVDSFDLYLDDSTFGVENPIAELDAEGETTFDRLSSLSNTFIDAVFFNVTGLPAIVSLICFTVPTLILAFISFDTLAKLLDAIIPF